MKGPREFVNPPELPTPRGFSHGVVADQGRTVWIAGQIAVDTEGVVRGDGFVEQFDLALANVIAALRASGAEPEHVVAMTIYTTVMDEYRSNLRDVGTVWRERMGRHYPAMAMLGVTELVEPAAIVELVTVAVVPPSP